MHLFVFRDSEKFNLIESNLWLNLAKENRKMGNMVASLNALKHAEHLCGSELYHEMAKWYWKKGSVNEAVKLLRYHSKGNRFKPKVNTLICSPQNAQMQLFRMLYCCLIFSCNIQILLILLQADSFSMLV